MVGNPKHVIEMKVQHPLFKDRIIPIIPHKTSPYGTGSGFVPVNPAHSIDDNEHAEMFHLPTKGFVNKSGEYKHEFLGDAFKGKTIEDEDFIYQMLKEKVLCRYEDTYETYKVKASKEPAIMISLDAWFVKLDESIRMKILNELPFVKYRPSLNIKDQAEID